MATPMNVGIYLFEDMTMLDGFAPLQILSFVEQFNTCTFARTKTPFRSDCGALLTPDHDFESCPELDIIVMPGGGNVLPEMTDSVLMTFLHEAGPKAQYVTSVCTGALILAEAGLLDGFRATTHWAWIEDLRCYDQIEVVDERVAVDRSRITGGGITAGIDFALTLIAEVVGPPAAQAMQLLFEYRPQPPYDSGSPATAPKEILEHVRAQTAAQSVGLREFLQNKSAA
jgi:transcriptional regulator GlxA family with amidase domain